MQMISEGEPEEATGENPGPAAVNYSNPAFHVPLEALDPTTIAMSPGDSSRLLRRTRRRPCRWEEDATSPPSSARTAVVPEKAPSLNSSRAAATSSPLHGVPIPSPSENDGEGMSIVLCFKISKIFAKEMPLHFQESLQGSKTRK